MFLILLLSVLISTLVSGSVSCVIDQPKVNGNSVSFGCARFTVETTHVIRIEWSPTVQFEDRPSLTFINRNPVNNTNFSIYSDNTTTLVISVYDPITKQLELILTYNSSKGPTFTCDSLQVILLHPPHLPPNLTWCPDLPNPGLLLGSLETTDCYINATGCLPLLLSRLQPSLLSRSGWTLVNDSLSPLLVPDMPVPWRVPRQPFTLDYHLFIHGLSYTTTLSDFVLLCGRAPLMPVNAYGVWWSRYWPYDVNGITQVVEDYASHGLPLHVVVLDIDWHERGDAVVGCGPRIGVSSCAVGYGGYRWNTTLFPDPPGFISWLHERGLPLMVNLHDQCGIDHCQTDYAVVAVANGVDPATLAPVMCRYTDRRYADSLFEHELGQPNNTLIDYYWVDYGLDLSPLASHDLDCLTGHCMHCLNDTEPYPILWSSYLHVARKTALQGLRGMVLGIYGGLGAHRFPVVGSGDTNAAWETLGFEVYLTVSAANVGVGWTQDLGGFYSASGGNGGYRDPEMLLRWLQFGALSPLYRTHCSHCEIRAWMYPNFASLKEAFLLRSRIFPYVYAMSRLAYETGVIIVRPMYYQWPLEPNAYTFNATQYMFGTSFLASPIASPADPASNLTKHTVWFPPGTWVHWQTGESITGPVVKQMLFSFTDIPLYASAGAVIPLQYPGSSLQPVDPLIVAVVPGPPSVVGKVEEDEGEGEATREGRNGIGRKGESKDESTSRVGSGSWRGIFYEDDGNTLDYEMDKYWITELSHDVVDGLQEDIVVVTPGGGGDGFPTLVKERNYEFHFRGFQSDAQQVLCNGVVIPQRKEREVPGWWMEVQEEGRLKVLVVAPGRFETRLPLKVVVTWI